MEIKAIDYLNQQLEKPFKVIRGRVTWEAISWKGNNILISRILNDNEKGGYPFMMGLRYNKRTIDPDTILIIDE